MREARYQAAIDVFDSWREDVQMGTPPELYPVGDGELKRLQIGPQLVTLIGGAPGAGKTALTMQFAIDALRLTPTLRVLVCNVEMPPATLLDRQLARLSGVDLTTIRHRRISKIHADRIDQAMSTLESLAARLCFVQHPFDLDNVAASGDAFNANLILLDYIQRIVPPGNHDNRRNSVDATMNHIRRFADAGRAVIVVSALARSKDKRGRSTYAAEGLNLASFRETSELEFGADDAFILTPDSNNGDDLVAFRHLKSRYGQMQDLQLDFNRSCQRFTVMNSDGGTRSKGDEGRGMAHLSKLWDSTPAAANGEDGAG